jgi:energy-coupling factor transporter ATP-binding protein EcfA2
MINLELIQKLSTLKIQHRNWLEALNQVYALLLTISPGEVICITGPSRAGKTKLIYELQNLISGDNDFFKTGLMPVVITEAVNCSTNGSFSTKSFTKRLLRAIKHPMHGDEDFNSIAKQDRLSEDVYRQALEIALLARGVKYLFIDEAQHARYVGKSSQGAYAVMDSWKCLAQVSGIVLIIVGAYPILDILRNSPHMVGRKYQVNLDRYQLNNEDLIEFTSILDQYGEATGCSKFLLENFELLYKGSLGCIGLLRAWLLKAFALSSVRKSPITTEILLESQQTLDDLSSMAEEIQHGEKLLESMNSNVNDKVELAVLDKKKGKSNTKPFQRKAERIEEGIRLKGKKK